MGEESRDDSQSITFAGSAAVLTQQITDKDKLVLLFRLTDIHTGSASGLQYAGGAHQGHAVCRC